MNLRERILALAKPTLVPHDFGGVSLFLRKWNEREQIEWAIETQTAEKQAGVDADLWTRCKAIARSLCDDTGALVFSPSDYSQLAELDSSLIDSAWTAVIALQSRPGADDAAKKN